MLLELASWSWISATVIFALGAVTGYVVARQIKDRRTRELEQALKISREELASYRGDVNKHFLKTSLLFNRLTDNYQEVYQHLADGAQTFCGALPDTAKADLPRTSILPTITDQPPTSDNNNAAAGEHSGAVSQEALNPVESPPLDDEHLEKYKDNDDHPFGEVSAAASTVVTDASRTTS